MAYVLLLDQLERLTLAAVQAVQLARALGRDVEPPDWFEARERFDRSLAAAPAIVDHRKEAMLVAMGLREAT